MYTAAIYPGTFDPITLGHIDLVERASIIFERLIIAIADSNTRKVPLFTLAERLELTKEAVKDLPNVEVDTFDGLLVDYAKKKKVHLLIRGLRAYSDFEYEFQMALTNRQMAPEIETFFLMPKENYSYICSSTVREIASLGGEVEHFVTPHVLAAITKKKRTGPNARK